jgi:hypothetical protein
MPKALAECQKNEYTFLTGVRAMTTTVQGMILDRIRRQDYRKMQEMIFGSAPTFEHLLDMLRHIENEINEA